MPKLELTSPDSATTDITVIFREKKKRKIKVLAKNTSTNTGKYLFAHSLSHVLCSMKFPRNWREKESSTLGPSSKGT